MIQQGSDEAFMRRRVAYLARVQRQAARFICEDYKSRDQGCVTKLLEKIKLPSLQDRRKQLRLAFFVQDS